MPIIGLHILLLSLSTLMATCAVAGSFSLSETRFSLDSTSRTAVLKIRNNGDSKLTVQVSVVEWRQAEDGSDRYEPSSALAFFPKIAEIEPGGDKTVRLGSQERLGRGDERALRLFVEELPLDRPGEKALRFALKLGVPVFVAGQGARPDPRIQDFELRGDTLQIRIRNDGTAHTFVSRIAVEGFAAEGSTIFSTELKGWYVLAGATRLFRGAIPSGACAQTGSARVTIELQDTHDPKRVTRLDSVITPAVSDCARGSLAAPRSGP